MFKKITAFLLVAAMAFSFVACGNSDKVATNADTITVAITKDENTLTPFTYLTGTPGLDVTRLIFDSLYTKDKDNNVIPWMASSCDNDAEYKTFTIKLAEGQKWHDGKDVTLEDVKFTFEYVLTQASTRWKKIGAKVESVTINGDAVVVKTKDSEPTFVSECLTDLPIVPKHIYENVADAKTVTQTVGSGAFKLQEYVQDQKYVLVAHENYFKGEVKVKQINMPIVTDTSSIYQGIKTEQYTTFTGTLTPELVESFENEDQLTVQTGAGFGSNMLYMNHEVKPFDNVEFRQAIALAINSDEIVNTVYLGKADKGTAGYYSPASPYVKEGLNFTYNKDEANKKLDALGYDKKDSEGYRLDKDGKRLSFRLFSTTGALRLRAAELISEQLKAVGIEAKVQSFEPDTLDTYVWPDYDITNPRNYDMTVFGWSAPGQTQLNTLLSNCSADPMVGTYNLSSYNDAKFKALEDQYNATLDVAKREEIVDKMQELIAETVPFYTYAYQNVITVYNHTQYGGFVLQNGVGIINVFSFVDVK